MPTWSTPGDLPDMLDMVGDLGERGRRLGMGRVPGVERGLPPLGLAGIERLQPRLLGGAVGGAMAIGLGDEAGIEIGHHHAAVRRQQPQHVVGHVARMVASARGRSNGRR